MRHGIPRSGPALPSKIAGSPLHIAHVPHGVSLDAALLGSAGLFDVVVVDTGSQSPEIFAELVERASILIIPLSAADAVLEASMHIGRFGRRNCADGLSKSVFVLNLALAESQSKTRTALINEFGAGVRICATTIAPRLVYQTSVQHIEDVFAAQDSQVAEAILELRKLCRELFDPSLCPA
jgi:hypothetical protein